MVLYIFKYTVSRLDERVQEVVNEGVKHTASAFNSQNARIVLLLGGYYNKL
ncbi:UNVERIFIED_ORG: putative oxidoreductase (fatty acid repression mutant protein) [Bacillus sp. PvP124]|nr:putative oxidoreductase (fatty acid repression mutant protein) [Bacillus sp. PvP124]